MKKFLIIILLLIFPLPVNAGIICNDGWESSCIVSGPGCCSHHGGVDSGSEHQNVNINNPKAVTWTGENLSQNPRYYGQNTVPSDKTAS